MSVNINAIIAKIYEMGTVAGQSGKIHELSSAVDREEGELLFEVIKNDPGIVRLLKSVVRMVFHLCTFAQPFKNEQGQAIQS